MIVSTTEKLGDSVSVKNKYANRVPPEVLKISSFDLVEGIKDKIGLEGKRKRIKGNVCSLISAALFLMLILGARH